MSFILPLGLGQSIYTLAENALVLAGSVLFPKLYLSHVNIKQHFRSMGLTACVTCL